MYGTRHSQWFGVVVESSLNQKHFHFWAAPGNAALLKVFTPTTKLQVSLIRSETIRATDRCEQLLPFCCINGHRFCCDICLGNDPQPDLIGCMSTLLDEQQLALCMYPSRTRNSINDRNSQTVWENPASDVSGLQILEDLQGAHRQNISRTHHTKTQTKRYVSADRQTPRM